jgi:CRP-like cAMP-binding protein
LPINPLEFAVNDDRFGHATAPSSSAPADPASTWRLSEMDLFADFSPAELELVAAAAPMRSVSRGALLYAPHRPLEVLYIVKRGRVRIYRTALDGRSLTTAIVGSVEIFGNMPHVGQRMGDAYAEMLEPGLVCPMSRKDVQRLFLTDVRIVARITALLGGRIADLENRLTDTVLKSVPARICSALATLAGSPPVAIRLTHDQLADLVGTTRETTTKVLGELKDRHLIQLRRGRIEVLDPVALLELSSVQGPRSPMK